MANDVGPVEGLLAKTGEELFVIDRAGFPALIDQYEEMCRILHFKPAKLVAVDKDRPEVKYNLRANTLGISLGVMETLTREEMFSIVALETTKRAFMDTEYLATHYGLPTLASTAFSFGYKFLGGDAVNAFAAGFAVSWFATWLALRPNTKLIDGVAADLSNAECLHTAIDKLEKAQQAYDRHQALSQYEESEPVPGILDDGVKAVLGHAPEIRDKAMLLVRPKISVTTRQGHLEKIERERHLQAEQPLTR